MAKSLLRRSNKNIPTNIIFLACFFVGEEIQTVFFYFSRYYRM